MIDLLGVQVVMKCIVFLLLITLVFGCSKEAGPGSLESPHAEDPTEQIRIKEAREDSIELAEAYYLMNKVDAKVHPLFETDPVRSKDGEDAADDPAFWYNHINPDSSLVFGTNKKGGIYAYNLKGHEVAYYEIGLINNIDIRKQVSVGGRTLDLLGGSNRTDNSVILFEITLDGKLQPLLNENHRFDFSDIDEVYGFCLYRKDDQAFAVVNGKNGRIRVLLITEREKQILLEPYLQWDLDTQPEGMVADDQNNMLYVGEEENGIWKVTIQADAQLEIIPSSQKINNPDIEYDIEGLALYKDPSGDPSKGFLLASIQGSFSYAIFDRSGDNQYLMNFTIDSNDMIDRVEETDGLEIYSESLNELFPYGLLIVQDGFNFQNDQMENQNFKLVSLEQVLKLLKTPA